jgi:GAF domain-containing protein
VAELEVINRVSQAVSQMLNLDQLYRIVHSQINQLIDKTDMIITLYDEENEQISFPYISVGGELKEFQPSKLGQEINSLIIISQRPLLLVEDVKQRATELGVEKVDDAPKSWLGVPMMIGEEIIGGVAIQDQELEHRFTEDDTELLTTIASQIAVAIKNTSLVEQIKRSARRERLIHEITREVRSSPDIGTILETTVREIGRSLHAAKATVRLGEKRRVDQQPADSENKGDQDGG